MTTYRPHLSLLCFALSVMASIGQAAIDELPAEKVRIHFEVSEKLNPKKAHLYDQLVKRFGHKMSYSTDEVIAIDAPLVPNRDPLNLGPEIRTLPVPYDAFTPEDVETHFALLRLSKPATGASMDALRAKYGIQPWYLATELRDVEANGADNPPTMVPRTKTPVVIAAEKAASTSPSKFLEHWKPARIRKDWTDVMFDEDPSQDGIQSKAIGDLVGATFSYASNNVVRSQTWNTAGALVLPWFYDGAVKPGLLPSRLGFAPSVSLLRISTNASGPRSSEVDQLLYRLGGFAEWYEFVPGLTDLQLRAAFVYGTDTGHHASMTGFEFDLEPRSLMRQKPGTDNPFKLGYRNTLWRKAPLLEDGSDQSLLDYQLRVWVHGEGGSIQDSGKSWGAVPNSFFRIGPTAQLRINMPKVWKGFSITAQYSELPTISGAIGSNSLLKFDANLTLLTDPEMRRKISLNANYTKGGLNFTKQGVDVFTVGLSVLF